MDQDRRNLINNIVAENRLQANVSNRIISSDIYFNMDEDFDSFLGEDYLNYTDCLIGPDVNFANITQHEPDEDVNIRLRHSTDLMQESDQVSTDQNNFFVKSPWHESDSGVSEAHSFIGSPPGQKLSAQPNIEEEFAQKYLSTIVPSTGRSDKLMPVLYDDSCCNIEKVLCFQATQKDHVKCISMNHTSSGVSGQSLHNKGSKRKYDFSDNEDYNSDEQIQMVTKPSTVYSTKIEVSGKSPSNVVKKIVRPSTLASYATTQNIMKALNERSKKNAQQAKINREKKKIYIKKLEDDRESLLKDNSKLSLQIERMTEETLSLEAEVKYLKSVLANASALSGLLRNIGNIKEVKLSTSLTSTDSKRVNDHSCNLIRTHSGKEAQAFNDNAGVCLHVNNGEACLEFCAYCSSLAQKTHKYSDDL